MEKTRGFEIAKGWEDKEINLPKRATTNSAGYDFEAAEDVIVFSKWKVSKTREEFLQKGIDLAIEIIDSMDDEEMLDEFNGFMERAKIDQKDELIEYVDPKLVEEMIQLFDKLYKKIETEEFKMDFENEFEKIYKANKPVLVPTGIKAYMLEDEKLDLYNRSSNPLKNGLILTNGVGLIDSDYYENESNDGHIMFQFINNSFDDIIIKKGDRIGQGVFTKFLKADNDVHGGLRTGGHGSTK